MKNKSSLSAVALGLAMGVFWSVVVLLVGFLALYTDHGKSLLSGLSMFHLGNTSTVNGILLAGLMAFVDAFLFGYIIAVLYNIFCCCCPKSSCTTGTCNCCSSPSCKCECLCCKK